MSTDTMANADTTVCPFDGSLLTTWGGTMKMQDAVSGEVREGIPCEYGYCATCERSYCATHLHWHVLPFKMTPPTGG